jgi:FkbM family methyltransferase
MALNIKKISNYYKYPKDRGLNVFAFFMNGIIGKIFGQNVAAKFLRRYILGYRDFYDLLLESNGKILHIGACKAEEAAIYQSAGLGAIFIEANPALEEELKSNIAGKTNMEYIIALAMESVGQIIQFNISNNIESSSALKFSKLASGKDSLWPDLDLKMVSTISLESTTIAQLIESGKLIREGIDHIVVDTQGTELKVLQGMPASLLKQASFITLEASTVEIYEGQDLLEDIKKFLAKYGYRPMWQPTSPHADLSFKRY